MLLLPAGTCMNATGGSLEGYCDATAQDRDQVSRIAEQEASDALVVPLGRWMLNTDLACR